MPRLLIAPDAGYVTDETASAVEQFVREGGVLMATGDAFAFDEYGAERTVPFLSENQQTAASETTFGEGTVRYRRDIPEARGWRDVLADAMDAAKIELPVSPLDHWGSRPWGVHTATSESDDGRLVYVINLLSHRQEVRIQTAEPFTEAVDLVTGKPRGPLVELAPLEFVLLRIGAKGE